MSNTLGSLSKYVYGTTRLGDEGIPFDDRVSIAEKAMGSKIWLHTSHQYGDALKVLRTAFDRDRMSVPPAIFKIGWSSPEEVKNQIELHLESLNIPSMGIGQLCPGGALADDIARGGTGLESLKQMKSEGLVQRYLLEVWPWTSHVALEALTKGHLSEVVDGLIFYLNPLQRFVTNELWDMVQTSQTPVVAMRTVAGGDVRVLRDNPDAPEYLRKRAAVLAPIFESSGVASWPEFAARFSLNLPLVQATVGSTSNPQRLNQFLSLASSHPPLEEETVDKILGFHRLWSDDHDIHCAPWTM